MEEKSLAMEMLRELKSQNVRLEKAFKGLLVLCIILIVALVGSNIVWLIYESQYETVGETTTVDSGNGAATYLENSGNGDINYGKDN
jgi:ABC-type phosphate transport system permease subunit